MIKVAIVDDHQLFLKGMTALLAQHPQIQVVGSFEGGKEFLKSLEQKEGRPNVVLLDLSMPDVDGFAVLDSVKKVYPNIKFIALSMHDDANYIVQCVRKGAFGYLLKNSDEHEVVEAIMQVFQGSKYYKREISEKMLNFMSIDTAPAKKLTKKETEVLGLIADGLTTTEIAEKLFISDRTAETHRANILKKLEAKNTAELVKIAFQMQLL